MAQTTMSTDFLETFNVIAQFGGNVLGKDLRIFAGFDVFLTIQEPQWNFELAWILNDRNEFFNFIGGQFTGTFVDIDFGFLTNQIPKTTSNPTNLGQSKYDIAFPFDVGIENTKNVLEFRSLHQ